MLKYCKNSLSQPLFAPSNSRSISHSALGDRIGCASAAASADPTLATALGSGTGASSKRLKHGEESGILSSSKMDLIAPYFFYIYIIYLYDIVLRFMC